MRFLFPLLLALSSPAAGQVLQTADEALLQDGAEYARQHAVSSDEALRRLRAQEETIAATDRLASRYSKRLAGISIEHEPEYRIVVTLTGGKPVSDEAIAAAGMNVPVVFRTGAPATRARILKAIEKKESDIRAAFPEARGMGVDPRAGELVVILSEGDTTNDPADVAAHISEIAGVPARVRLIEQPDSNLSVEGGARVVGNDSVTGRRSVCTVGFVVTDGARSGIVTAAHCPDTLTYAEPGGISAELPFVGQWGWSFQDVQVNLTPDSPEPLFYADAKKSAARIPAAARSRASTRAGDFVCHRGERTGYSCGEVELTDYAPPGDLCGGPCAPDWVTVRGAECGGGDSGGPVFAGTTAFGIMKGGSWDRAGKCAFYYYMSLDYLPQGWALATRPPSPSPDGEGDQAKPGGGVADAGPPGSRGNH